MNLLTQLLVGICFFITHTLHAETPSPSKTVQNITSSQPAPATPLPKANVDTPLIIDCKHSMPQTTPPTQDFIIKWATQAAQQSFLLDFTKVDAQLDDLKTCYTDQGWQSFKAALQQSGNLETIKQKQLVAHMMPHGETTITTIKDGQWQTITPLKILYQNTQQKITQLLTIRLIIQQKKTGELGITQIIATSSSNH